MSMSMHSRRILLADGKVLHEKIRVASLKGVYADCLEIPEEELDGGLSEITRMRNYQRFCLLQEPLESQREQC